MSGNRNNQQLKNLRFTDSYTFLTMNDNILCCFPYDTSELLFSSRGLSNLPSEIQGAQACDISIPKEPAYSKLYI